MARKRLLDKRGNIAALDHKFTGEEPTWTDAEYISAEEYYTRIDRGLRFYTYYCDAAWLKTQTLEWMAKHGYSKQQVAMIRMMPAHSPSATTGKLIRMLNRGMPDIHHDAIEYFEAKYADLPEDQIQPKPKAASAYIHAELSSCLNAHVGQVIEKTETTKPAKPRMSPQTRLENKIGEEI